MTTRTRFSPSPTGKIHLGNVRAALYSALFASKHQGVFVLRIEDTDAVRSEERYVDSLMIDLKWLGIEWQEGPAVHGDYGPYWQSQRQSIYEKYYQILEEKKLIYPCFCTDQELNLSRKLQLSRGQAPRYARTCRGLSQEEIEKRLASGRKPAWRFEVPSQTKIEFVDTIKGPQAFQSDDIGDFIVRRADGTPPFLFCNAIDDAEMKISHVLRGEDHLANTPRQIMLLKTLNLPVPYYGHLPLIVGDDGAPLSKRHGSFSVEELRKEGYLSISLINYLSRLGHSCDTQALLPFHELAKHFDLEKLSRSPARFDKNQLLYWQKLAVQSLDMNGFWRWIGDEIQEQIPAAKQALFVECIKANVVFPHDVLLWGKIFFHHHIHFDEAAISHLQEAGEQFFVEAEQAFDQYGLDVNAVLAEMKKTLGLSGKKLFMPLRLALTGQTHGPELAQIATLLGQKKIKERLGDVIKQMSGRESSSSGRVSP